MLNSQMLEAVKNTDLKQHIQLPYFQEEFTNFIFNIQPKYCYSLLLTTYSALVEDELKDGGCHSTIPGYNRINKESKGIIA